MYVLCSATRSPPAHHRATSDRDACTTSSTFRHPAILWRCRDPAICAPRISARQYFLHAFHCPVGYPSYHSPSQRGSSSSDGSVLTELFASEGGAASNIDAFYCHHRHATSRLTSGDEPVLQRASDADLPPWEHALNPCRARSRVLRRLSLPPAVSRREHLAPACPVPVDPFSHAHSSAVARPGP